MPIDQNILKTTLEKLHLNDFFVMNKESPSLGQKAIVLHEGKEKHATFVEWHNGCVFGFLIDGQFFPNIKYWKYPEPHRL